MRRRARVHARHLRPGAQALPLQPGRQHLPERRLLRRDRGVQQKLGCTAGEPVGCGDPTPCTIDACDEATHTCKHAPRDVDQDGDPDAHCAGGGDCDDNDPDRLLALPRGLREPQGRRLRRRRSTRPAARRRSTTPASTRSRSRRAARTRSTRPRRSFDYASSCGLTNPPRSATWSRRSAPRRSAGRRRDHGRGRSSPTSPSPSPGSAATRPTEIACGGSFPAPQGGKLAKLRGRGLGERAGADRAPDLRHDRPRYARSRSTSSSSRPTVAGQRDLRHRGADRRPACPSSPTSSRRPRISARPAPPAPGNLVYAFTLASPANIDVYASSVDGDGTPSSRCAARMRAPTDEITCQTGAPTRTSSGSRSRPATYYVSVSASAPTEVTVTVELSPPTAAAARRVLHRRAGPRAEPARSTSTSRATRTT